MNASPFAPSGRAAGAAAGAPKLPVAAPEFIARSSARRGARATLGPLGRRPRWGSDSTART
eukprot:3438669-Pyramimonas_sp.AAC.1